MNTTQAEEFKRIVQNAIQAGRIKLGEEIGWRRAEYLNLKEKFSSQGLNANGQPRKQIHDGRTKDPEYHRRYAREAMRRLRARRKAQQ